VAWLFVQGRSSMLEPQTDLCAPSQFREDQDAYRSNTGLHIGRARGGCHSALRRTGFQPGSPGVQGCSDRTARRLAGTEAETGWQRRARCGGCYDELVSKFPLNHFVISASSTAIRSRASGLPCSRRPVLMQTSKEILGELKAHRRAWKTKAPASIEPRGVLLNRNPQNDQYLRGFYLR